MSSCRKGFKIYYFTNNIVFNFLKSETALRIGALKLLEICVIANYNSMVTVNVWQ